MSKSGLFAHFKSKEHVELELLDQAFSLAIQHVETAALKESDGLPRLIAAVHAWIGWYTKVGLSGGCPVAAAMFELDDVDGPLRDGMLKNVKLWHEMFKNFILGAIREAHLRKDTDVDQFFWELQGIYLAHHISTRFFRDTRADERADRSLEKLIVQSRNASKSVPSKKGPRSQGKPHPK